MKQLIFAILFQVLTMGIFAQDQTYTEEIEEFQKEQNEHYKNPQTSPLEIADRIKFVSHDFFPIDEKYKVVAKFTRISDSLPFKMKTTGERLPEYRKFGIATFVIDGEQYSLSIYQNIKLIETEEYRDYLFLPFTDLTNGKDSYIGGRYIDLKIPISDTIVVDFNKAYNPYCAYSYKYSCPIPLKENHLTLEIEAGIKMKEIH